jgi:hypothetical protein
MRGPRILGKEEGRRKRGRGLEALGLNEEGRADAYAKKEGQGYKEEAESKGLREGRSKEEEERPRVSQGDEGRVYARNEAEPKRRGGPRALGFQSDLYNHKKKTNFQCQVFTKLTYANERRIKGKLVRVRNNKRIELDLD